MIHLRARAFAYLLSLLTLFILIGCSEPRPEFVVDIFATSDAAEATATALPTETSTALPTLLATTVATEQATETALSTATPQPTAPPTATKPILVFANNDFTIDTPIADGHTTIGRPLTVAGQLGDADSVRISLTVGNITLVEQEAIVNLDAGTWTAVLDVPQNVSGPAWLSAVTDTASSGISLYLDPDDSYEPAADEPVIRPFRPNYAQTAVSGYPLYFAGEVTNPIDNQLTLGLLVGGRCANFAAQQPITLSDGISSTSLSWHGLIILPRGLAGQQACAVAYTGTFGEGNWRGVILPLNLYGPDDERIERIQLESATGLAFLVGETGRIAGTAVNATALHVAIKDPANDTVLVEGETAVADFGFWEISLPIPTEAPNIVNIEITIFDESDDNPHIYTTTANIIR